MGLRVGARSRVTNRIPANAGARIDAGMRDAIADGTRLGRRLTASLTPRRRPYTYSTVESALIGGGAHVSGHFGSDYEVFEFLEKGTRPHPIPGAFGIPGLVVQHPGTDAVGMLDRAGPIAGQAAKEGLGDVFEEVFG